MKKLEIETTRGKIKVSFTPNCTSNDRIAMAGTLLKTEAHMAGMSMRELLDTMIEIDENYEEEQTCAKLSLH